MGEIGGDFKDATQAETKYPDRDVFGAVLGFSRGARHQNRGSQPRDTRGRGDTGEGRKRGHQGSRDSRGALRPWFHGTANGYPAQGLRIGEDLGI